MFRQTFDASGVETARTEIREQYDSGQPNYVWLEGISSTSVRNKLVVDQDAYYLDRIRELRLLQKVTLQEDLYTYWNMSASDYEIEKEIVVKPNECLRADFFLGRHYWEDTMSFETIIPAELTIQIAMAAPS